MALNTVTFSTNEDSQVQPKFIVVYLNNTCLPQKTVFGNKGILHIYIYNREHGFPHTTTALQLVAATTP